MSILPGAPINKIPVAAAAATGATAEVTLTNPLTVPNHLTTKSNAAKLTLQPTTSSLMKRAHQACLRVCVKTSIASLPPLPCPSPETLTKLDSLHPSFLARSAGHIATVRRLAVFLELPEIPRLRLFVETWEARRWAPSTAETYWGAILGGMKALGLPLTPGDRTFGTWLEARAAEWQPAQAHRLSAQHIVCLERLMCTSQTMDGISRRIITIIAIAWLLGARLSDALQLAPIDIFVKLDMTIVTFRRGKVIPTSSPFALALPPGPWTTRLQQLAKVARAQGTFLASQSNTAEERSALTRHATSLLKAVDEQLECRSVRRGGLFRLAQSGLSVAELRTFSRHTSDRMCLRYLAWGADVVDLMTTSATAVANSL